MFFPALVNSRFPHVTDDLLLHMILITDWIKWGHMFQEDNIGFIILRTAVFDVINHSPSHCVREWQVQRFMGFVLNDGQLFLFPVKVFETKVFDVTN